MNQIDKFNQNYKVQKDIMVQWGDMDAFNHVNNTVYFKYFETARIEYFFKLGVMDTDRNKQVAPILAETSCRFKLPINFPDTVIVGANVSEIHSHGFLMEYGIYSKSLQRITSVGLGRIVMLDYSTHQKVEVNEDLIAIIESLEGKNIQRM
jgi:acyl-CoA thioester hydrolase